MSRLPNFLVIGVAKAGTTALYEHLRAHPDVFMSGVKEPNFFSHDPDAERPVVEIDPPVAELDDYRALFEGACTQTAVGEASPRYFHSRLALERIEALLPSARIVAMLRQPVERAYSHYLHMLNSRVFEHRPFEDFFREKARTVETWGSEPFACYGFNLSFYYDALRRYRERFPDERMRVYLFEDYAADPRPLLADLYRFLGVDDQFVPELDERHNPTYGVPKSAVLHRVLMQRNGFKAAARRVVPPAARAKIAALLLRRNRTPKPALSRSLRDEFTEVYRDDILKTQALLDRDLSSWLP